ncbi:MAG: hypothetical protein HQM08_26115 [Candidatus Riflebacteria bacterium]|nr:hypothetical protein [Candidatus Riflebacteria bacterium]
MSDMNEQYEPEYEMKKETKKISDNRNLFLYTFHEKNLDEKEEKKN